MSELHLMLRHNGIGFQRRLPVIALNGFYKLLRGCRITDIFAAATVDPYKFPLPFDLFDRKGAGLFQCFFISPVIILFNIFISLIQVGFYVPAIPEFCVGIGILRWDRNLPRLSSCIHKGNQ